MRKGKSFLRYPAFFIILEWEAVRLAGFLCLMHKKYATKLCNVRISQGCNQKRTACVSAGCYMSGAERPHTARLHAPPQGFLLFYRDGKLIDSDGGDGLGLQKTAAFRIVLVLIFDAELRSGWIGAVQTE